MRHAIERLAAAACCVVGLLASIPSHAETTWQRIQRTGEVRIGYANEVPFAYSDLKGKVTGESPEIAKVVFACLGIPHVKAILTEWGALIPGLQANRFDVIAAGMYITPDRMQQVLFADPHYQLDDTLLVRKGNARKLHSFADIARDPTLKLAVMAGTVEYDYAIKGGVAPEQILQVPNTIAQFQAVKTQRAHAAVGTRLTMKDMASKSKGRLEAVEVFHDDPAHMGYGALAFRKEDQDLRDAVNEALQSWVGSEAHLRTIAPFGFDRRNLTQKKLADFEVQP
ncbi:ectoine/hydroxyectoine ABC transporter substrate-binding protein EhuB [uncultured Oxalicibacterium sp.]|uniref:ectoine/hydroxyectoine ABC transporter substrate-binding protein EhuB n=1 Tax=uncultured Oxalicibacterium sp. TaxID=1168540 RepID=UPI0025F7BD1F|nr:ectoine/hydroxyectoine ABC transporter substrate-binding protein EhuB [uncultured Oxalicibacterium sp.]